MCNEIPKCSKGREALKVVDCGICTHSSHLARLNSTDMEIKTHTGKLMDSGDSPS
jgi:hypothetical protein